MKRKIWFSFLLIALSAAMIGGATMAWFTAQADAPTATFTAGTVVVGADQGEKFIGTPEGKYFENVNPGDCATVYWDIINEGTKAVELKVKLDKAWENDLPTSNVYYAPRPDSGWVMYEEDGEIWLAYTGGPVPGTYGNTDVADRTVSLPIVVGFDGEQTDNQYQGKRFTLNAKVYAVQASNGAPAAVFGNAWMNATSEGYSDAALKVYFLTGNGKDMPCWPKDDEPQPVVYPLTLEVADGEGGTVDGAGSYAEGTEVYVNAIPGDGYSFEKWTKDGETISTEASFTYTMPASAVTLVAHFVKNPDPPALAKFRLTFTQVERMVEWGGEKTKGLVKGTVTALDQYDNPIAITGSMQLKVFIDGYSNKHRNVDIVFDNNSSFNFVWNNQDFGWYVINNNGGFPSNQWTSDVSKGRVKTQGNDYLSANQSGVIEFTLQQAADWFNFK